MHTRYVPIHKKFVFGDTVTQTDLKKNAKHADGNLHGSSDPNLKERMVSRSGQIDLSRFSCRAGGGRVQASRIEPPSIPALQCTSVTVTAFRRSISSRAFGVDRAESGRVGTNGNGSIEKEGGGHARGAFHRQTRAKEGGRNEKERERIRDEVSADAGYAQVGTRSSGFPVGSGESLNQLDLNR